VKHRCQWALPDGTHFPAGLAIHGPIANVILSRPDHLTAKDESNGEQPQQPDQSAQIQVRMLVDTGATKTVIDRGIAESLGLEPIRYEEMIGVSHVPEDCPVYLLCVSLPLSDGAKKTLFRFTAEMVGMSTPPTSRPFNGLLGRDFLSHLQLDYRGKEGYCDIIGHPPDEQQHHHGSGNVDRKKRKTQRQARRRNRH